MTWSCSEGGRKRVRHTAMLASKTTALGRGAQYYLLFRLTLYWLSRRVSVIGSPPIVLLSCELCVLVALLLMLPENSLLALLATVVTYIALVTSGLLVLIES